MKRAILVTGGAGYIGSHTVRHLTDNGFAPVVIDDLSTGHRANVTCPFVEAKLSDRARLDAAFREHRIEAVVHFAASAYVGESVTNPSKYFQNNVVSTLVLLDAMHAAGVRDIVFSSTCATYGIPLEVPITEATPQHPVNPYGESKLFVERALHWYGEAYGLRSVALRYFNAAGAHEDGTLGEEHEPEVHLIPLVVAAALGRRESIDVYGTDYPTPDGTAVRDYVHVADLAQAHVDALAYLQRGGARIALNIGTGTGHSVREVIASVERVGGRKVTTRDRPRRAGDPPVLVADGSLARTTLGWQPRYTDLDAIVKTAWRWHESR
jgi:UDP-glucose-4-epimerase GalE